MSTRACEGRIAILVDGGVRRGSDIAKAIALGAEGVILGRAPVYGLAAGGEAGVTRAIEILADEFDRTLALTGCRNVAGLTSRPDRDAARMIADEPGGGPGCGGSGATCCVAAAPRAHSNAHSRSYCPASACLSRRGRSISTPSSAAMHRGCWKSVSAMVRRSSNRRSCGQRHGFHRRRGASARHRALPARDRGAAVSRNVRLIAHDAVEVLTHQIGSGTLDEVLLYFPDPWPKKRHHKRRIVQPAFAALVAQPPQARRHISSGDRLGALCLADARSAECRIPTRQRRGERTLDRRSCRARPDSVPSSAAGASVTMSSTSNTADAKVGKSHRNGGISDERKKCGSRTGDRLAGRSITCARWAFCLRREFLVSLLRGGDRHRHQHGYQDDRSRSLPEKSRDHARRARSPMLRTQTQSR